jgi:hypothetical protein
MVGFTNWLTANHEYWFKSIDQRYTVKSDQYNLLENVTIDDLIYNNNISGWWSCGYIEAAQEAEIILQDTWNRPL